MKCLIAPPTQRKMARTWILSALLVVIPMTVQFVPRSRKRHGATA
jgi:hypothetical protein